ncbi:MAG TPA: hypothetical protein ENN84_11755 [Candidatus Marinimicrobia bacterium]|nr:hypothetical protein [Candidatus Neomarinimicrobiota bacterium]
MRLRLILAIFLTCSAYSADSFLAGAGSRGLAFLALSPVYGFDAAAANPAVLPQTGAYQLSYSPMWSDYGIQELSLSLYNARFPLKPVFNLNGQMHELITSYFAVMQFRFYQSESVDIGGAFEWSMLQVQKENATHKGHLSMGFLFHPLEKMALGVSYLHLAEYPSGFLSQRMPLFNLALNYQLQNLTLMAGYQKAETLGGAAALAIQGNFKEILSYGLAWNGSNEMLSANLSFFWRHYQFRQMAGWHRYLGLIPVWSIEYQDTAH